MATDLFRVSLLLYSDNFASFISHCRKLTLYSAGLWWKSLSSIVFCGDIIWRRKNLHKTLLVAYISLTRCYISVIKSLIAAYNVTMAKMTASYRGECIWNAGRVPPITVVNTTTIVSCCCGCHGYFVGLLR